MWHAPRLGLGCYVGALKKELSNAFRLRTWMHVPWQDYIIRPSILNRNPKSDFMRRGRGDWPSAISPKPQNLKPTFSYTYLQFKGFYGQGLGV